MAQDEQHESRSPDGDGLARLQEARQESKGGMPAIAGSEPADSHQPTAGAGAVSVAPPQEKQNASDVPTGADVAGTGRVGTSQAGGEGEEAEAEYSSGHTHPEAVASFEDWWPRFGERLSIELEPRLLLETVFHVGWDRGRRDLEALQRGGVGAVAPARSLLNRAGREQFELRIAAELRADRAEAACLRLREERDKWQRLAEVRERNSIHTWKQLHEAEDENARLRHEIATRDAMMSDMATTNARLREERDKAVADLADGRAVFGVLQAQRDREQARADAAEAENAPLRQLAPLLEDALKVTRNYYNGAISRYDLESHQDRWKAGLAVLTASRPEGDHE